MNKYPYNFNKFREAAESQFVKDYYADDIEKGKKVLKDSDIQKAIVDGYNSNKYKHENNISEALKSIDAEVSGTVYCMYMLV